MLGFVQGGLGFFFLLPLMDHPRTSRLANGVENLQLKTLFSDGLGEGVFFFLMSTYFCQIMAVFPVCFLLW